MGAEPGQWPVMRRDEDGLVLPSVDMDALDAELRKAGWVFEDDEPDDGDEADTEVAARASHREGTARPPERHLSQR